MQNTPEKKNYQHYLELGGIINEKDYDSAIEGVDDADKLSQSLKLQAEIIARTAGIELENTGDSIDKRVVLYEILRSDTRPEGVKRHHDEMSDQRIFMEALRMLGDTESINKMIEAFPNISFKY